MTACVQVTVHLNAKVFSKVFDPVPRGLDIKQWLEKCDKVPSKFLVLHRNGKVINDDYLVECAPGISPGAPIVIRAGLASGLLGGKGGFGAMLRALAKQTGAKKTTDFGACRDLSGRRLRHVNDELILQKWKEAKDKGEEFDVEEETATGIDMWYLSAPSWAEGIKVDYRKRFMKPRRKTSMCIDWMKARENRKAPEGAPAWWGCPRGRRCEFAHGESELRGHAADLLEQQKNAEVRDHDSKKRDAYVASIARQDEEEDIKDMVLAGLRAQKRARMSESTGEIATSAAVILAKKSTESKSILPIEGLDYLGEVGGDEPEPDLSVPPLEDRSNDNYTDRSNKPTKGMGGQLATDKPVSVAQSHVQQSNVKSNAIAARAGAAAVAAGTETGWIKVLAGDMIVTSDGEIESKCEFGTVGVTGCGIVNDKYYYEVELLSSGIIQIGWANHKFLSGVSLDVKPSSSSSSTSSSLEATNKAQKDKDTVEGGGEDGVGDDHNSWAFDGRRLRKWHGEDAEYGTAVSLSDTTAADSSSSSTGEESTWKAGDVVGCLLEFTSTGEARMAFTLNGVYLGVAYTLQPADYQSSASTTTSTSASSTSSSNSPNNNSNGKTLLDGLYPAISLEDGEAVLLNIGQRPFQYPPSRDIISSHLATSQTGAPAASIVPSSEDGENTNSSAKKSSGRGKGKKTSGAKAKDPVSSISPLKASTAVDVEVVPGHFRPVWDALDEYVKKMLVKEDSVISASIKSSEDKNAIVQPSEAPSIRKHNVDTQSLPSTESAAPKSPQHPPADSTASSTNVISNTNNTDAVSIISSPPAPAEGAKETTIVQKDFPPIDLESAAYPDVPSLEALGLQHLKSELERRGLKAGGSLKERAERLFSVRGLAPDQISHKLKAKRP